MSIYKTTGGLLFGTRLKRLSDKFLLDLSRIYKNQKIDFEVAWFPAFYLLGQHKEITISDLARQMEITHSGASQMVTSLQKKGFLKLVQNRRDKRVKTIRFTEKGQNRLEEIQPVWIAIKNSMDELMSQGEESPNLFLLLDELESRMKRIDLVGRVQAKLDLTHCLKDTVIRRYTEADHTIFMDQILKWLTDCPCMMPENTDWINDPRKAVIEKGNTLIFLAFNAGELLCSCVAVMDGENYASTMTLIPDHAAPYSDIRLGEQIIQILLDEVLGELAKQDIVHVTAEADISDTIVLKMLRKNDFKLQKIEKRNEAQRHCTFLHKKIKQGT